MTIVAVGILFAKGESMKLFIMLIFACLKAYSGTQVFEAVASTKGEIVYVERHTLTSEEGTLIQSSTEYIDLEGKFIGSMMSNYTQSLSVPDYTLRDERQQSIQGLRWLENKLDIFTQSGRPAKVIHKRMGLDPHEVYIAGPGLIYYVGAHLDQLVAGHIFKFKYVIPGKFQTYDFYIETIQHNQQEAEFDVKLQSWQMRLFGAKLKLIYSILKKRILFYEGPSNLRDKDGKMMSVRIEYKYPD